jgi:hypothetical protein
MNQTEESSLSKPKTRRTFWRILYSLLVLVGLLLAVAMFIPVLDGPHSRQRANAASAVSKLLTINTLQTKYSAAHPERGFACELPILKPAEPPENADYDPLHFLVTGAQSGYKFALGNCQADAKGVVVHYQATAVPVEHGVTGFRAFCTDESGLIWYDKAGSEANCLASRRSLE